MSDSEAKGAHRTEGTARKRKQSGSGTTEHEHAKYTDEQLEAVKTIRQCKNYYEILGVATDCTDEDLKKAYKKLALKFHPDKNHAPGATEAFKAIGNAFAVLSNSEKRQRYDHFGTEEENVPVASHRHYHNGGFYEHDYTRGFEGDVSPEEIFNMFFGGAFQVHTGARVYRQRTTYHQRRRSEPHNESSLSYLFQLAPVLILLLVSLITAFMASDPNYSLRSNHKFATQRQTANLRIPYYVKADFATSFKGSLRRLEQQVEEDHIGNLKSNCLHEKSYRDSVLWHARSYGDKQLYEETLNRKLPNCEALQRIYG